MRLTSLSSREIRIDLTGMTPGEKLSFEFIAMPIQGHTREVRISPRDPVADDGRFTLTEGSLDPLPGNTTNAWTIKVVHSTGVACQDVVLP